MKYSQPANSASLEMREDFLNINSLIPTSPMGMSSYKDFFNERVPFNILGCSSSEAKYGFESFFDRASKMEGPSDFNFEDGHFDKVNHEEDILEFGIDHDFPAFKKPISKLQSEKYKESETTDLTKENLHCGTKRKSDEILSINSKCNSNLIVRNNSNDEYCIFEDQFAPNSETVLPDLNSLVSLSLEEDSGILSVTTFTHSMNGNKLLTNFLTLADEADLIDLQLAIKACEAQIIAKMNTLTKLNEQTVNYQ
jgi:hypothetical protein